MNLVLRDLISKMMIKNPNERITIHDIRRHDWVTSNGVQVLPPCLESPVFIEEGDINRAISQVKVLVRRYVRVRLK